MKNRWNIYLAFEEDEQRTACTATLSGEGAPDVRGHGYSRRNPQDEPDTRIGEEIAAARACSNLAHEILEKAAGDIEARTHRPAHLSV
ncbi:DUF1876 domain-containing protein [Wenjunlia tyrosinilytica]|uniref:DUF1876 domain-containing protein n=1 Tax=Wenjunlia tyrosinilytica TaxID=1544741 RepID=A0A917ZK70_9ACTN|nr:DUF1876 domain-containing protein [Wenjunlia tyrosinilytica]GGO85237.1 hypothetical protein GCM10012280_18560 [Wenjunlia tyrosinilytica]